MAQKLHFKLNKKSEFFTTLIFSIETKSVDRADSHTSYVRSSACFSRICRNRSTFDSQFHVGSAIFHAKFQIVGSVQFNVFEYFYYHLQHLQRIECDNTVKPTKIQWKFRSENSKAVSNHKIPLHRENTEVKEIARFDGFFY